MPKAAVKCPPASDSSSAGWCNDARAGIDRRTERPDRNLPSDLDDLIGGQAEEVADMGGVALHDSEDSLLPGWQAHAVLAGDHRLVAHVIGHVVEVDCATQRFAGGEQFRNMRALHEAEASFGAPEVRH